MIANLQIKKDNDNIGRQYDIERKNKLLVEMLEDLLEQEDITITAKKKIGGFIKSSKV